MHAKVSPQRYQPERLVGRFHPDERRYERAGGWRVGCSGHTSEGGMPTVASAFATFDGVLSGSGVA